MIATTFPGDTPSQKFSDVHVPLVHSFDQHCAFREHGLFFEPLGLQYFSTPQIVIPAQSASKTHPIEEHVPDPLHFWPIRHSLWPLQALKLHVNPFLVLFKQYNGSSHSNGL